MVGGVIADPAPTTKPNVRISPHPAYAGYLVMALGLSLGYSSLAGLLTIIILLLPSLIYRINVEEKLLADHFGEVYRQYIQTTKHLIPGIW
jgi:protein-S-isoprenylcysteine O-methyltransferase Ste14